MDYRNELLDAWVGTTVIVGRTSAPTWDVEAADKMVENPMVEKVDTTQSRRGAYKLVGYDAVGVTLRHMRDGEPPFFVPWGAILELAGRPPR